MPPLSALSVRLLARPSAPSSGARTWTPACRSEYARGPEPQPIGRPGCQRELDPNPRAISMLRPAVVMSLCIIAANLPAQTIAAGDNAPSRTAVIAASFSKYKDVTRTKRGITKSKYRRVESEPAVRANPADYSGS